MTSFGSRAHPRASTALRARLCLMLALLAPMPGCIQELIVDVEARSDASQGGGLEPDAWIEEPEAGGDEHDASGGEHDAGGPVVVLDAAAPPVTVLDARIPNPTTLDAAPEAGSSDAGNDTGIVVLTVPTDAGCKLSSCDAGGDAGDAGKPTGPCPGGCEIASLTRIPCASGEDSVCWSEPNGTCSYQCPGVKRCKSDAACEAGQYCYFEKRDCGASGELGHCARPAATCPSFDYGSCGCDGKPYMNGCFANQAGTDVSEVAPNKCK